MILLDTTDTETENANTFEETHEETLTAGVPGELQTNSSSSEKQNDWFVKTVFTVLGVGSLLPWNVFVSADDYFERRPLVL